MYQSRFEMRIQRHVESGTVSLLDSRLMQKTKRQIIGYLKGQVSMHVASLYKSVLMLQASSAKLMYTRYCVRPKLALHAMQILVFLWLCKKIYICISFFTKIKV